MAIAVLSGASGWQNRAVLRRSAQILLIALAVVLGLALAGCGSTRPAVPSVTAIEPWLGVRTVSVPAAGVHFIAPADWAYSPASAPLVASFSSGRATVAVWRYPRTEPLPGNAAAIQLARQNLISAIRSRDPHVHLIRARLLFFARLPAVELAAIEHVNGYLRRVRSIHVYAYGAETVIDEYAPPADFHTVDRLVFTPLGRSLRLTPAAGG